MHAAELDTYVRDELGAVPAGTGMWGRLYLAPDRGRCYRLIPNTEVDLPQRAELQNMPSRPQRHDLATVVADWPDQRRFGSGFYQMVVYQTSADRTLADEIARVGPRRRVEALSQVLKALPGWWDALGTALTPLPADIVLDAGRPLLLPLPALGPPSVPELFAGPERIAHLAPEVVRGVAAPSRADAMFSLATMVLRCLEELPDGTAEQLLHLAACATLTSPERCTSRLPLWMQRLPEIDVVLRQARALTGRDPAQRATAEPAALAELLDQCRKIMDPEATVRGLRAQGKPRKALELAQLVLLDDDARYDLLMLSAQIARHDLDAPLEALSLLERAVRTDPAKPDAYEAQFELITGAQAANLDRLNSLPDVAELIRRLDDTARTAFDRLPPARRRACAHDLARYLMARGLLNEANRLAYAWMHEDGRWLWWMFPLTLDYAESFLRLGRLESAHQALAKIKQDLRRARERPELNPRELHEYGLRLARLELRLNELRKQQGGG